VFESEEKLAATLGGILTGALMDALNEMANKLRQYSGENFNRDLDAIETIAVRSIENSALDDISEERRQFLIERARGIVAVAFRNARYTESERPAGAREKRR
jgi:hypothetical protein